MGLASLPQQVAHDHLLFRQSIASLQITTLTDIRPYKRHGLARTATSSGFFGVNSLLTSSVLAASFLATLWMQLVIASLDLPILYLLELCVRLFLDTFPHRYLLLLEKRNMRYSEACIKRPRLG